MPQSPKRKTQSVNKKIRTAKKISKSLVDYPYPSKQKCKKD